MKKFLYSVLALGAVATLASCSSEEPLGPGANDGKVTFNICLEGAQTRAFGETTDCNEIYYTVFDMDGNVVLADEHKTAFGPGVNTATVELQLVANQQYQVIFYAHNSGSEFSKYENGVVTVDYTKMNVNSTIDDAFINKVKYTPAGGAEVDNQVFTADGNAKTVYLTRPFAQVNFGTDDLDNTAVQKIISGVTTTFEVSKGLNTTYTVIDGTASGTPEYPVTASTTTAPADNQDFPVEPATYDNLLSVYLLVPQTQDMIDATYTINLAGKPAINNLNLANMPVQGNYRTNVYGSLLTTQNAFNVVIEPNFGTPDNDISMEPVEVTTPEEFVRVLTQGGHKLIVPEGTTIDLSSQSFSRFESPVYMQIDGTVENIRGQFYNDVTIIGKGCIKSGMTITPGTWNSTAAKVDIDGITFDITGYSNRTIMNTSGVAEVKISNCKFLTEENQHALSLGKGLVNLPEKAEINNCQFINTGTPIVDSDAIAVYAYAQDVVFNNCLFSSNAIPLCFGKRNGGTCNVTLNGGLIRATGNGKALITADSFGSLTLNGTALETNNGKFLASNGVNPKLSYTLKNCPSNVIFEAPFDQYYEVVDEIVTTPGTYTVSLFGEEYTFDSEASGKWTFKKKP